MRHRRTAAAVVVAGLLVALSAPVAQAAPYTQPHARTLAPSTQAHVVAPNSADDLLRAPYTDPF